MPPGDHQGAGGSGRPSDGRLRSECSTGKYTAKTAGRVARGVRVPVSLNSASLYTIG